MVMRALPAVVFLAATVQAQGWQLLTSPLAPTPRNNHASAYDLASQQFVVFGDGASVADTWTFDAVSGWSQVTTPTAPTAAFSAQMAFDVVNQGLLLFGGQPSGVVPSPPLGETWLFANGSWQQLTPANAPSPRYAHAMVSDIGGGGVLLFGGRDITGLEQNDTWRWDGSNWTLVATVGPPVRCCHDLAHDQLRNRTVLFGGWSGTSYSDTWEWDGSTWTSLAPANAPAPMWGHRMAYDVDLQRVVLSGGTAGNATWLWDGTNWTLLPIAGPLVYNHGLHYDYGQNRLLTFGGYPLNADTWSFEVQAVPAVSEFGSGCAGPAGQPRLSAGGALLPWIGNPTALIADGVPTFGLFVLGFSNTTSPIGALPASLLAIGMPGCDLLVSPDAVLGTPSLGGPVVLNVSIPLQPTLVATSFFAQTMSLDLLANPLGLTASNGLQLLIGQL